MTFHQCPRSMSRDGNISALLPLFYRYVERGFFPDGKGMIDQPLPLINAFEIFVMMHNKFEKEDFEERTKKK